MLGSISDLIYKDIKKDTIIIRFCDNGREVDILSNDLTCVHLYKTGDRCNKCGAFVGIFGKEVDYLDYCRHIYLLSNSFKSSLNLFIVSDRIYPPEFKLGSKFTSSDHFKYCNLYTLYNRVLVQKTPEVNLRNLYVIHFTNDRSFIWKNKFLYCKGFNLGKFLFMSDTLFVNPNIQDFNYSSDYFYFKICNKKVLEFVSRNKLRFNNYIF